MTRKRRFQILEVAADFIDKLESDFGISRAAAHIDFKAAVSKAEPGKAGIPT